MERRVLAESRSHFGKALLVGLILAGLSLAACGGDGEAGREAGPGDPVTEIVIEMGDNYFAPDTFTVQAGTTVTITARNTGNAVHNLIIDSQAGEGRNFSSELMVTPGEADVFEATFTQAGTYRFQCSFHLPDQVGTVHVVE